MPGSRPDWSARPDFHPEFGRLCPSPRRRRGMRLAVVSVIAILAIGATMGLAVAHWRDGAEAGVSSGPGKEPRTGVLAVAKSSALVEPSAPTDSTGASPVARAQESCEDGLIRALAAVFLNSTCGLNKPHARHGARAANRVATVIIGRKDTESPSASTTALEPAEITAGGAEKSVAATTPAVERPAPRPKKPKVTAGGAGAYASVPQFGRAPYDPYRYDAPRSGFDGRFGRSW
jgi:hypothetical protein